VRGDLLCSNRKLMFLFSAFFLFVQIESLSLPTFKGRDPSFEGVSKNLNYFEPTQAVSDCHGAMLKT
jgi:hypothetical protein